MSQIWDIADDVFATHQAITLPQTSNRRPFAYAEASSMLQLALVFSLTTATAIGVAKVVAAAQSDGISAVEVVFQRARISLHRPPTKARRSAVDFERARTPEKLAKGFQAYFKPSRHIDDSSDDGFVFD